MHSCLLSPLAPIVFYQNFFNFPPPCLVSHFSLFTLLFTLPDFLQQLASPACLHFVSLCSLCLFAAVRVSRTAEESVRFRPPLPSTAPYPNAESTHVRASSSPAQTRPGSEREIVLQPSYLSPAPRCGRDKPNGPIPSVVIKETTDRCF